jgi:D-xylose transport system substrate-binding protein
MKRITICLIVFAFCLQSKGQDSTLVGFSLAYLRGRWYSDTEYLEKSLNKLGGKLITEFSNADAQTQNEQILSLIKRGVKVMIIVAEDAESLNEAVEACKRANVKVIAYDRLIKNCDIDYYVSFDGEKVGKLQAGFVTNILPKGNVVLLAGPITDNNAVSFLKGQKEVLEPFIQDKSINIIYEKNLVSWDVMAAYLEISQLVENNVKIDAVIASDDECAAGSIMAFENNEKYKNVIITGQDAGLEACKAIVSGKQSMTVYKSIKLLAFTTANLAINLAKGEKVENSTNEIDNGFKKVPAILLDPVSVDKTNLKETVIKDGFLTEKEIFGE